MSRTWALFALYCVLATLPWLFVGLADRRAQLRASREPEEAFDPDPDPDPEPEADVLAVVVVDGPEEAGTASEEAPVAAPVVLVEVAVNL